MPDERESAPRWAGATRVLCVVVVVLMLVAIVYAGGIVWSDWGHIYV